MKMWRPCFLFLICSCLCVAFGLSGCGDNPCEDGEPDTCANIEGSIEASCLVIGEDDFACLCQDMPEIDNCWEWNENTHVCDPIVCD